MSSTKTGKISQNNVILLVYQIQIKKTTSIINRITSSCHHVRMCTNGKILQAHNGCYYVYASILYTFAGSPNSTKAYPVGSSPCFALFIVLRINLRPVKVQ